MPLTLSIPPLRAIRLTVHSRWRLPRDAALRMDWSWFELLAVYYFCVNLPSVLVQGTCAVHYGGRVDELGIRLLFDLLPIFYTKVRTEEVERRAS